MEINTTGAFLTQALDHMYKLRTNLQPGESAQSQDFWQLKSSVKWRGRHLGTFQNLKETTASKFETRNGMLEISLQFHPWWSELVGKCKAVASQLDLVSQWCRGRLPSAFVVHLPPPQEQNSWCHPKIRLAPIGLSFQDELTAATLLQSRFLAALFYYPSESRWRKQISSLFPGSSTSVGPSILKHLGEMTEWDYFKHLAAQHPWRPAWGMICNC